MQIHIYEASPLEEGAEAGAIPSNAFVKSPAVSGLSRPGGSAAMLDIHYHGGAAGDLASNPAGTIGGRGSAAMLDIHYHGGAAGDLAGLAAKGVARPEAGGVRASALGATRPSAGLSRPGGSAAMLDIHYHGGAAGDLAGLAAKGVARPEAGGSSVEGPIEIDGSLHIFGP